MVEFPDGTSREVMERAMRQHYGGGEQPHATTGGFGEFAKRELGLGTRAMLEGGLSTLGIVTDPLATLVGLPSAREGATALADTLGLPVPQTRPRRFPARS